MKLDKLAKEVLHDLVPFLPEGYVLTGSAAYTLLVPALSDKIIKDVDVVVYPLQDSNDLVDKRITDKFYINQAV
ncbi:MAG: hypothetical protein NT170_03455 [Candidatus Moranbacteria bacterium]|nr:hypothetical protein [Candidatus Moranbacteria bacterium]